MIEFVQITLLTAHLLCMNVASAGPLLAFWLEWNPNKRDTLAARASTYLGAILWPFLLLGVVFGLLLGITLWNGEYSHIWLVTLRHKAGMAVWEFLFSFLLLVFYAYAPRSNTNFKARWRWFRMTCAILSSTNLLYHFPFLFSVATTIHETAPQESALSQSAYVSWMLRPEILARVTHVILASIAVSGVILLGFALRLEKQGEINDARRVATWGGWWALIPSLFQLLVGLWFIAVLPAEWQARVMGEDWLAPLLLGVSVFMTIFLLQDFAALALGEFRRSTALRSMVLMVLIVLLMSGTLHRMRG